MKSIATLLALSLVACNPLPAVKAPPPAPTVSAPSSKPLVWEWVIVRVDDDPENPFSVAACDAVQCDRPTGYRFASVEEARETATSLEHHRQNQVRVVERIK